MVDDKNEHNFYIILLIVIAFMILSKLLIDKKKIKQILEKDKDFDGDNQDYYKG